MEHLYDCIGISRQAFHQQRRKIEQQSMRAQSLVKQIRQLRSEHPRLSCRKIYRILKPDYFGRDRFEQFCFQNGFKLYRKRSYHRTTDSRGVTRFDNLLPTRELTGVNQVWVSDITYYRIGEQYYYLTFIMDRFSRLIVGYSAAGSLHTDVTTLPALTQAVQTRKPGPGLILHSDGGGQYYANEFKELTSSSQLRNSMAKCAYENPHAERLNGIIKNDYLSHYKPTNLKELVVMLTRAVYNYNNYRPHTSLKQHTPVEFERSLINNSTPRTKRKKEPKKEKLLQQQQ
jgi:transposase InsO family protein